LIGGEVARAGLRLAVLLVLLSVVTLAVQDRGSAEFVVSVMALGVSLIFLAVVLGFMRLGTTRLPARRDDVAPRPRRRDDNVGPMDYTNSRSAKRSSDSGRES
jgi:hypothetical protein